MTGLGTKGAFSPRSSATRSPSWNSTGTATCAGIGSSHGARSANWYRTQARQPAREDVLRGTATAPSRAPAGISAVRHAPPLATAGSRDCAPLLLPE
eukprot:3536987-Heterocapsa_arctica.AAC.1